MGRLGHHWGPGGRTVVRNKAPRCGPACLNAREFALIYCRQWEATGRNSSRKSSLSNIFFFLLFGYAPIRGFTNSYFYIKLHATCFPCWTSIVAKPWLPEFLIQRFLVSFPPRSLLSPVSWFLFALIFTLKFYSFQMPLLLGIVSCSSPSVQQLTIITWTSLYFFELSLNFSWCIYFGIFGLLDWALWVQRWDLNVLSIIC